MTLILSFVLGVYVYISDKKSKVNRTFVLLILSAVFWIISNFMTDISRDIDTVSMWSKLTLIGPIFIGYFFYRLSTIFPREQKINRFYETIIIVLICIFIPLSFTRLNIVRVYLLNNGVPEIEPGPLYIFFLMYFLFLTGLAFKNLFKDYKLFSKLERLQVLYISLGLGISAVLGSITNVILPILNESRFVNFGPYFILFFTFFTSYAIIKFKMFDIKIITTQLLVFSLWIFIFLRMLIADNTQDKLINAGLLILLVTFGTLLIRSVIREVEQREKIEKLALDLQKANERLKELDKQKSEFVSFATHQLRAPLTAMKGYASLILDGDMGELSTEVKDAVARIFESTKTLATIVDDYLNISRIELGTVKYSFEEVDLAELVGEVIAELKPNIEKSKLAFSFLADPNKKFMIRADKDKFKQIITNLIDNSMKYTPSGSVTVSLTKTKGEEISGNTNTETNTEEGNDQAIDTARTRKTDTDSNVKNVNKILFSIKDTGIGIRSDIMPKLFAKFSRADNANKQNIHGTGLGLYVAKEIVSAHKGRIWAESAGEGKGSAFFVELEENL